MALKNTAQFPDPLAAVDLAYGLAGLPHVDLEGRQAGGPDRLG